MARHQLRYTKVPWVVEESDLREANNGEPELSRELTVGTQHERHLGLHVVGQFNHRLTLGLLTLRCERVGARVVPLTLSIADSPPPEPVHVAPPPPMNMALLKSNPRRIVDYGEQ